MTETRPILALRDASKAFGAINALENVSIDVYPGESHSLVGENGAGKSTLVKILAGVHLPDRGTLSLNGERTLLRSPAEAREAGIAIIHQEPVQFPDISIAENIFTGRQPLRSGRRIDRKAMDDEATMLFGRLGVPLDPDRIARGLSIAEQQIVEIAKALSLNARVIVMDEPTAALSAVEVDLLVGAGRTEVASAIFGIDRFDAGRVIVNGKELGRGSPAKAMGAGIGFVPEDRRQQGLVMEQSIARNLSLASLRRLSRFGLIRAAAERRFARDWAMRLQLKYGRLSDPMTALSGGNQQKAVLAKWLGRSPSVLIVDEPTRGIDVGTKAEVHRLLEELAGDGVAILVVSSELPEVLRLANRILVMREGRLVADFDHADASEQTIVAA